jgi:hypothetical protein
VIEPVRLPGHLVLAVRAVSAGLFDGLHLDVEPHALKAWHDPSSRGELLAGTVELLDRVRSVLSDADIDAAVNPVFAAQPCSGEMFLTARVRRLTSVSIMSCRDDVAAAISWPFHRFVRSRGSVVDGVWVFSSTPTRQNPEPAGATAPQSTLTRPWMTPIGP